MTYLNKLLTTFLTCSILLSLAGCPMAANPPKRTFQVQLHSANHNDMTITYKDVNTGEIVKHSCADKYFSTLICLTPEDYKKERVYQADLIKSCKRWR